MLAVVTITLFWSLFHAKSSRYPTKQQPYSIPLGRFSDFHFFVSRYRKFHSYLEIFVETALTRVAQAAVKSAICVGIYIWSFKYWAFGNNTPH